MKTALLLAAASLLAPVMAQRPPLAWIRFDQNAADTYAGHRYHFLGDGPLHLAIDLAPDRPRVLDLLWGSKNDERGAVLTINGTEITVRLGGYQGYRWHRIEVPPTAGAKDYRVVIEAGPPKAGFLAALKLSPVDAAAGEPVPPDGDGAVRVRLRPPPPSRFDELATALTKAGDDPTTRARIHAAQANEALRSCRRYLHGWLAKADPVTGLIPQNLRSPIWNGRNAAADNYAFMVLTAAFVEPELYAGRMQEMLASERRVATGSDGLPRPYDLSRQELATAQATAADAIFDGSEYVKDGLMPITEWLGDTPWSERMIELVDALLAVSDHPTAGGPIPADNVEVNGEMMQVLSRLCFRCDDERYLDMACRIADYYLLGDRHPTRDALRLGLRDHNCELISGLTEVYAACSHRRPAQAAKWREPLHAMLDDILAVGIDEHGLMYQTVAPRTGEVLNATIHDNWGYNFNGFLTVHQIDGVPRYRRATRRALACLQPHYWKHPWQGWGSDGIADAVEGAINLFNREPDVAGVAAWIDANIARMFAIQKADGIVEGWHGDGNFARTALLWVLWKQQGVTLSPWREDVMLGAIRDGDGLHVVVTAERDWTGKLVFDTPRHREHMRLPLDYPRINQFPEWWTVEPARSYRIGDREVTGRELASGVVVTVAAGAELQRTVRPVR